MQPRGGFPVQQRIHHLAGGVVRRFVAAIDDEVGLGIDRVAAVHQFAQRVFPVTAGEQRTIVPAGHPTDQSWQGATQPNGHCLGPRGFPRQRIHECAATECENHRIVCQKSSDHPPLAVAECGLSITLEEFGDRATRGQFDFLIGVAERQAETRREPATDGCFASSHQPDQDDAAAGNRLGKGNSLAESGGSCHGADA